MTKSQKNVLGEINRCEDLSAYSTQVHDMIKSGKNHDLVEQINEYARLHHEKRISGYIAPTKKSRKLALKSSIMQALKVA